MSVAEKPGLVVSSTAHIALLAAAILSFSRTPPFQDAQEAIPVEMVSTDDLNQIMHGDKTAKAVQPTQKADKVADIVDPKPQPPLAEAKKDVPIPPPPLKREPDPGEADKPEPPKPQEKVAVPPPPPRQPTPAPVAEKPPPPPPPPPPEDAEASEPPKPVPRPKIEPPKPDPKPETAKPEPPKPEPPKEEAKKPDPKLKLDEVAKLLDADKRKDTGKPKPKSGEENTDPQRKLNLADISKLLSHNNPESKASTDKALSQQASLGSPTASASKMSPSLLAQMEGWFQDRFQSCWTTPISQPTGQKYVPLVRVPLNIDGSLAAEPTLVNPPSDPAWQPLTDSALRAIRKCNPLPVPDRFKPYYEEWRGRIVRFNFETT